MSAENDEFELLLLPQECLDPLIGLAAGVATVRLTMEQLQDKFTAMSKPSQNP